MENKYLCPTEYPDVASTSVPEKSTSPFAHKDLKKSLEEIASDSSSKKDMGLLEDLFSDKAKTLKASVNAMLEEIKLREDLNASHFGKIDGEVRRLHSELMNLDNVENSYDRDLTKDLSEGRARIKDDVLELERERRSEGLECWRDLMFLKKYLMVSLKDYWELVRKRGVLGS